MMTIADTRIFMDIRKQEISIIRSPGNLPSYMIMEATGQTVGKRRLDPYFDFEVGAQIPSDSGIVSGDLVLCDGQYYLVMALEEKWERGALEYFRATLYKCNATISIYYYNASTGNIDMLHKSGVHCLITQVRAQKWLDDKAILIKQFQGRHQPFQLYTQISAGITKNSIIVDQADRSFRINKEFDIFIADNIIQCEVLWRS